MPTRTYKELKVYRDGCPDQFRRDATKSMLWRPTVTMLVHCRRQYLVTRHVVRRELPGGKFRWKNKPDLPKGGIDACDQTALDAVYRELLEEVCLRRHNVGRVEYLGHVLVPFDRHNVGRDGYSKGKWYFLYHVDIEPNTFVAPGRDHGVTEVLWKEDIASHFVKSRRAKPTKKFRIFSSAEFKALLQRQEQLLAA